jgi:DNA-binding NarL/FixJ family response regulator
MRKRHILLLCVESLFGESLERILGQLEDVELVGPYLLDADALDRLPEDAPDVAVIVHEDENLQKTVSLTSRILERYPGLAIVRVGLQENVMRVYASRTLPASRADLIEVIRSL